MPKEILVRTFTSDEKAQDSLTAIVSHGWEIAAMSTSSQGLFDYKLTVILQRDKP